MRQRRQFKVATDEELSKYVETFPRKVRTLSSLTRMSSGHFQYAEGRELAGKRLFLDVRKDDTHKSRSVTVL